MKEPKVIARIPKTSERWNVARLCFCGTLYDAFNNHDNDLGRLAAEALDGAIMWEQREVLKLAHDDVEDSEVDNYYRLVDSLHAWSKHPKSSYVACHGEC